MEQKLHLRQILTETEDGELEINEIESENTELNDELFNTIQKRTKHTSKIISIARIN